MHITRNINNKEKTAKRGWRKKVEKRAKFAVCVVPCKQLVKKGPIEMCQSLAIAYLVNIPVHMFYTSVCYTSNCHPYITSNYLAYQREDLETPKQHP